jgi:hypothetical protein
LFLKLLQRLITRDDISFQLGICTLYRLAHCRW